MSGPSKGGCDIDGRRGGRLATLLAGALLAASGCVYVEQQPGAAAAPPPGVQPVAPGQPVPGRPQAPAAQAVTFGAGISLGFLLAADPYLDPSGGFGLQATEWLNPMLGVELDIAIAGLKDEAWGGALLVVPVYVSAVLSLPSPETWEWAGEDVRWRLGVGVGRAGVVHTNGSTAAVPIFIVQTGYEEYFNGPPDRLFLVVDWMVGDVAVGTSSEVWDLTSMIVVRVGSEVQLWPH